MRWSLFVGRISGIKIFIHWTFLLLIFWIILSGVRRGYSAEAIFWSIGFILAVFVCITLHELGHAITAKRFNFKTRDITLLPIGGVARMEGLPDKPMQEFLVALMGPVVNLFISLALFIVLRMAGSFPQSQESLYITTGKNFWFQLYSVNLFLALFNLIPAFPMDGGRILRAILSSRMQRAKATRIAARVGQFIAIAFILLGFLYNPFLSLIGVFVFIGAQAETTMEYARSVLNSFKVGDLLMHSYSSFHPAEPLSKAVSLMLDSQERSFIIKDDGQVRGILSKKEILNGLSQFGENVPIEQIMRTKVPVLHGDDSINEVMLNFPSGTETLMPVFEGEEMIGVINLENINEFIEIKAALKESQRPETTN